MGVCMDARNELKGKRGLVRLLNATRHSHTGRVTETEERKQALQQAHDTQETRPADKDQQQGGGDVRLDKPPNIHAGEILYGQALTGHQQGQGRCAQVPGRRDMLDFLGHGNGGCG